MGRAAQAGPGKQGEAFVGRADGARGIGCHPAVQFHLCEHVAVAVGVAVEFGQHAGGIGDASAVAQQRDVPPCSLGDACPPYPSNAPARYVLELNAGEAARLDLQDGATIEFGPGIPVAD